MVGTRAMYHDSHVPHTLWTLGILLAISIFFAPAVAAFSGNDSGYVVQGALGWVAAEETAAGYNLTISGLDQPVNHTNVSGVELCLGFICPTKPYVTFIGVTPQNPRTIHVLDCGFNVTDTDIEESLHGNVTWYRYNGTGFLPWPFDDENNIPIVRDTMTNTSSQGDIEANDTTKHEQWKCSLRVTDGFYLSLEFNSTNITILNSPPVLSAIRTFLGETETSTFEAGDTVTTRVNVTDDDGRDDINDTLITIKDPSSQIMVNNDSMSILTTITNGYAFTHDYGLSSGAPDGTWIIDIFTNDTDDAQDANSTIFIVIVIEPTIQFILKINGTNATVFIPGYGSIPASSIIPTEYLEPEHYFLTSESDRELRSLVFSEREPTSLIINKTAIEHFLEINQKISNSKVFLVFTLGSADNVLNRIDLIESADFLTKISPTFGFGLGDLYPIKMLLQYEDIDLQGQRMILQKGTHNVVIESNKTDTAKNVIIEQKV